MALVGFGPFPGTPINPSAILVKALARRRRPALAATVRTVHIFATRYAAVDRELPRLFAEKPDVILMFGLAGRRRHFCIETRARNAVSLLFPDAGGQHPQRRVIAPGGPPALRSAAPLSYLLGALGGCAVPARSSHDAGRYLCNYAYWRALERARDYRTLTQFVHIPPTRLSSQRLRRRRRLPALGAAVTAAERLLVALVAASRR